MKKKYSAKLTGAWFLFFEIKQVAKLIEDDLNEKEIRAKVIDENLFQHKKRTSVTRAFPTVYRRARFLDKGLRTALLEESPYNGKLINLFAIMEEDLLFKEFMIEVIGDKYKTKTMFIEHRDINLFFAQKAEQNPDFSKYSATTINKLRQVYLKILAEAEIFDQESGQLNKVLIDPYLRGVFIEGQGQYFVDIFN